MIDLSIKKIVFLNGCLLFTLGLVILITFHTLLSYSIPETFVVNGFNAGFAALTYTIYAISIIVLINKTPSALSVGMIIGSSTVIGMFAIEHAIFWHQGALIYQSIAISMNFVSLLHGLLGMIQFLFMSIIVSSQKKVIDSYAMYESIPDVDEIEIENRMHSAEI